MISSRAKSGLVAAAVLSLLPIGCGDCKGGARSAKDKGKKAPAARQALVVHLESEPAHLVSMIQPDSWAHRIAAHNILESLVRFQPRPPHGLEGELATSWKMSEDGRTYTFELRKGVRWHDDKPFSARDVKFTFDRVLDEKVRAVSTRATIKPFIASYEQLGALRFRIVCRKASPFFLKALADVAILPEHLMRAGDLNRHPLLRRPVGTGPYRFARWRSGRDIEVVANESYWGEKARVPRIVYRLVRSPEVALQLARRGELDFVTRVPPAKWKTVESDPQLKARFRPIHHVTPGTAFVLLNHRREPFKRAKVRRALAMMLDMKTIVEKIMHGQAKQIGSLYWLDDPECDRSIKPIRFDPAAARGLLAEAGARDSDGDGVAELAGKPLRVTFLVVASSKATRRWLTIYQQELRKAGLALAIQPIEWAAFLDRIRKHDFDMAALGMALAGPYTDLYLQLHSSQIDDGQNYGAYSNPRVDELLVKIRSELDEKKRRELSHALQRLLAAELPVIPLFTLTEPGIVSKRVKGVYRSPLWYQIRDWSLE